MTLLWKHGGIAFLVGMLHWISRLFRRDKMGRQVGAIVCYGKESLRYMELCPKAGDEAMESLWARVRGQTSTDYVVVGVYIHPAEETGAEEVRRSLECTEDTFILQVKDKPTREGQCTHKPERNFG